VIVIIAYLPAFASITDGKTHEINVATSLNLPNPNNGAEKSGLGKHGSLISSTSCFIV